MRLEMVFYEAAANAISRHKQTQIRHWFQDSKDEISHRQPLENASKQRNIIFSTFIRMLDMHCLVAYSL